MYAGSIVSITEDDGTVSLSLPLDTHYRQLKQLIPPALQAQLPWLQHVRITLATPTSTAPAASTPTASSSASTTTTSSRLPSTLRSVRHFLAVSSCKGGVGKSTVAVSLAYSLAQQGKRVGLFDADLFGPSIPTLVGKGEWTGKGLWYHQTADGKRIEPYVYEGVKTMSYGYNSASRTANVMRGPIASTVIRDLLYQTDWGTLDYLVIDCPPGTSDILLTLTQSVPLSAAVVVSTPQRLAWVDVEKGMDMFGRVGVDVVAVVENMSYMQCGSCGERHRVFGKGYMQEMKALAVDMRNKQSGGTAASGGEEAAQVLEYELPIVGEVSEWGDKGDPFVLRGEGGQTAGAVRETYERMAREVDERLEAMRERRSGVHVRYEDGQGGEGGLVVLDGRGSSPLYVDAGVLRSECRCAACVDERTGERLNRGRIQRDVRVRGMQPRGNYAVAVAWSDGHASSLYTYEQIEELGKSRRDEARQAAVSYMLQQQHPDAAAAGVSAAG